MSLAPIVAAIAGLPVDEHRQRREQYVELVFFSRDTARWAEALSLHLGPPVKPPGTAPKAEQSQLASAYGGIHANQTLFSGNTNGVRIIAMFWPWQDGLHTTLKLAQLS